MHFSLYRRAGPAKPVMLQRTRVLQAAFNRISASKSLHIWQSYIRPLSIAFGERLVVRKELGLGLGGVEMLKQETSANSAEQRSLDSPAEKRSWAISFTSIFFALLQSACTGFMAISGLRLLIGIGSLGAATTSLRFLDVLHGAAIRIPMETVAVVGSLVNLYAVWRVRSLRARPSSQWRMIPPTAKQKRSESIQVWLAVVTLLLVCMEWVFHLYLHGTI